MASAACSSVAVTTRSSCRGCRSRCSSRLTTAPSSPTSPSRCTTRSCAPSASGEPAERAVSETECRCAAYTLALSAARKIGILEFGQSGDEPSGVAQMLGTILLIILILILLGALPRWPHSASWGYGPSGAVGVILIIVLILVLLGHV